jgi:hypothetical protein
MKLEGEIGEIDLTARLVELWREQFTGAIRFENDGIIKIIYFKSGDVLSASTNDRADSIDEILMRASKVTRDHVKQALAKRKESETLGDALLNLGFITRKELTWARRVQVIGVVRSINQWPAGSYTIVADYLPKREEGTLFPLPQLLVEMIVTEQDRATFERALDGGSATFAKGAGFDQEFERLGLNDEAGRIASAIDGERNASEVAVASGQDGFNTYKLLHALSVLGLVERVTGAAPAAASSNAYDFASAGVSDASDAWSFADTPAAPEIGAGFDSEPEVPLYEPAPGPTAATGTDYWNSDEGADVAVTLPDTSMPTWNSQASQLTTPIGAPPAVPPADAGEVKWGFDDAQIEAARRASVPMSADEELVMHHEDEPKSRKGLIVAILALLLIGAGAYGGFLWWKGKQAAETAAATPVPRPAAPRPATGTAEPVSETIAVPTVTDGTIINATSGSLATTTVAPTPNVTTAPATGTSTPVKKPVAVATTPVPAPIAVAAPPSATPAATSGGASRDRFDAMARDYAQTATGSFTVQVVIVCEVSNLEKAIRDGGQKVWFVPVSVKGRSCYRVFWGNYRTREEASRGAGEIPARLRESKPAVVTIPKR